jgi:hypothetical protein
LAAGGVDGRGVMLGRVGAVEVLVRVGVVDVRVGLVEVVPVIGVVLPGEVTVDDGALDGAAAQLPEINVSPGGTNDDGDVPGAAFTVIVDAAPDESATVNVQVSADAFGTAARASVASTELALIATIFSLRLIDTLKLLSTCG